MHRLPLPDELPYQFQPPKLSPFWVRASRLYVSYLLRRIQVVRQIEDVGLEYLKNLKGKGDGVLITPNHPDLADRASSETDRALELRTRDRQRKLITKIEEALRRIEEGVYGYCEETGEPIGLARLDARPIATLSLEAQERHERRERVHRDE